MAIDDGEYSLKSQEKNVKIKILGSGQDAGIPHTGCHCEICVKAREDAKYRRLGPSIAIIDNEKGFCYMIDASPDFKHQIASIREEIQEVGRNSKIPVSGILLTHAHFGHVYGLWHLGMETLDEKNLPVFCTSEMKGVLQSSYPFNLLVQRKNIEIKEIHPNKEFKLDEFEFVPIQVPHRSEVADTVGYIIKSKKKLIYLPDVDYWTDQTVKEIKQADIALIDGTFYTKDEISRYGDVPHPPMKETIELLGEIETEIYFTHINHTNSVNRNEKERKNVESKGFRIAYDGMILDI